jgi:hypothetical protein
MSLRVDCPSASVVGASLRRPCGRWPIARNGPNVLSTIDATSRAADTGVVRSIPPILPVRSTPPPDASAGVRGGCHRVSGCGGAAIVEFVIIVFPLLLGAMLVVEAARWQNVREVCQLALLEAARAGSTNHLRPAAITAAFEDAMTPLFVPAGRFPNASARMQHAWQAIARESRSPAWRIEVLEPSAQAFARYADPRLRVKGAGRRRIVRNDYQAEAYKKTMSGDTASGGPDGPTIFDANTLRLTLTYLHRPLFPPLRALLKFLGDSHGNRGEQAMARAGLLPITIELAIEMQSHPVQWNQSMHANPQ